MGKSKVTKLNLEQSIIDDYLSGQSCTFIAKKNNVSIKTISRFLKSKNIEVINRHNLQLGLKKDIFSVIDTEEKAYWLGFLYADGYVSSKNNTIGLTLKESDKSHLEKFNKFLGNVLNIRYKTKEKAYCIEFKCKETKKDLVSLGCVPNKTWIIDSIPKIEENLKIHFIRGYFDGDGCITYTSKRKNNLHGVTISITSNEKMLKSICDYLNKKYAFSRKKESNIVAFRLSSNNAIEVLNLMYENCSIYLDRKYNRYKIFKNNNFAVCLSDLTDY